jgi:hypothetical protein
MAELIKEKLLINPNQRTLYLSVKTLELDEEKLTTQLSVLTKFEKIVFVPLAIHLLEERKRLKVSRLRDRMQLKTLKVQSKLFKRKLTRMGVKV